MKVLHVIPSVASRDGGPAVAISAMAAALARAGVDVTVATTDADGPERLDVPLDRAVERDGVTYRYFPRSVKGDWKFSWPLTRWLADHARDFDVMTAHALFSYATIAACRGARRADVPYIIRPLGTLNDYSLRQKRWKKGPYYRMIERRHLAGAAAIHATSPAEAEDIARLGFGDRTRIIPLGVEPGPEPPRVHRSPDAPLRILFLSRLHPKKGLPLLFDAVARVSARGVDLHVDVAGAGEASYTALLRDQVRALRIAERVCFMGEVHGDDKRRAFASADVFVLPSSDENFGIAVAEALAAGLPVVVSDRVALAADVAAYGAGRVVPLDPEALASAIMQLGDRDVASATAGRARRLAVERYSWSRVARELVSLYAEVIEAARSRRSA